MPSYEAVLLDIEGTTTPHSFVYQLLFPYAREHLERFLEENWDRPDVQADVAAFRNQAAEDQARGLPAPSIPPAGAPAHEIRQALSSYALQMMDEDRKAPALKTLQGRIWEAGYRSGELQAPVFPDVVPALSRWKKEGIPVYIYSSGSVQAQKLLFSHTPEGDLTPLLSGFFDTAVGPKKEPASYLHISEEIGISPSLILFVTDNAEEAHAAAEAGMEVVVMERPGNPPQPVHAFRAARSFYDL
jgi:2,3-diketo-5-methylthio-1-phosphopentane phosphatase